MNAFSNGRKTVFVTVLTIVGIVAIVILATLQYRAVSDYRAIGETRLLVSDIESNVLTLRRNEKDFLTRKDPLHHRRFVDNYGIALTNAQKLREELLRHGSEEPKIDQLITILGDYRDRFQAIADLQKSIGFHHEDGLYGSLRKAIHEVEGILALLQQDRLIKDMLMLRRQEKDFMLRGDLRYTDKFDDDMLIMRSDLSRAYLDHRVKRDVFAALATYEKDFKALVSATQKMGFNTNEGLQREIRNNFRQSESVLQDLRQNILLLENDAGTHMINQIIISAVVLTILIGALIRI